MKSVPMEKLLARSAGFSKNGVKELNIIAQDTSAYGKDIYSKPMLCER